LYVQTAHANTKAQQAFTAFKTEIGFFLMLLATLPIKMIVDSKVSLTAYEKYQ
jgi:DNA anti-recombination protein RmuC